MIKNDEIPAELTLPDYNNSILNLSSSILQHFGVTPKHPTLPEADRVLEKHMPHVVVILLDGLGMNILEKHLSPKDFLRRNLITDYSSVFPPTTTASTTSFLSGLSPIEHGWLGWDVYFEQENKTVTCFHNTLQNTETPAADYHVAHKYLPYENIIDQINKAGTAKAYKIFPFGPESHPEIDDWCNAIEKTCHTKNRTFTYAYWENPDSMLHSKGTNASEVEEIVRDLNAKLALLCSKCKDTTFFITADHGHTDIRKTYLTEDYTEITDMLIRETSLEPRAISFYVKPEYMEAFPDLFNRRFSEEYHLFSKKEVLENNLFGPGKANENLTGIGDFVAVAYTNKTLFWQQPKKDFRSHHAGMTKDEMLIPLIGYTNIDRHVGTIVWYTVLAILIAFVFVALF